MDLTLSQIEQTLKDQLKPLEAETQRLKQALAEVEEQSARIRSALTALGGGSGKAKPPKARKPCPTQRDVREILVRLLQERGSLAESELEELAKSQLREEGKKSLSGFVLRFQETLSSPGFSRNAEGLITLSEAAAHSKSV